jgi:spectinomycin phosphotransferase
VFPKELILSWASWVGPGWSPWDTAFAVLTPPAGLDESDVIDALARFWALEVGHLAYIPKGFGSYHWCTETPTQKYFLTVDDLDTKPWLGGTREATFGNLRAAYGATLTLHQRGDLDFIVAPVPRLDGGVVVRLSERYGLTVFPFLSGQAGVWGEPIRPPEREQLFRRLAQLHQSTESVASQVPRHGLAVPGRALLVSALNDRNRPWTGGPLSEPARQILVRHAETVERWLNSFDHLARLVQGAGGASVVTHGEPHPGNLIRCDGGPLLVDWDTMGLAPPERDLWMLDDGSSAALGPYTEVSGRPVDASAISLFRLAWTLSDIAVYVALFRSDHASHDDTEKSLRGLSDSLSEATSVRPYGV